MVTCSYDSDRQACDADGDQDAEKSTARTQGRWRPDRNKAAVGHIVKLWMQTMARSGRWRKKTTRLELGVGEGEA